MKKQTRERWTVIMAVVMVVIFIIGMIPCLF